VKRTFGITLDPAGTEPIYRQIADQIAARVRSGALPSGFKLPPSRSLAEELDAHRNTVVRAYEELEAAGYVTSTVGRGTFVALGTPDRSAPGAGRAASGAVERPGLPWESLVTNAAATEPLRRFTQFVRPAPSGDVVNLTLMQPPAELLPVTEFRRCVDHVLRGRGAKALGYAPREGVTRLRELIAADLERQGVPASPDDVVVTTGSQQAIDVIARLLVRPGDIFLVNHSTYGGAIDVLSAAGARLVGVPSDDEGPDMAALDALAASGAKGFYLMPSCQNPTGEVVSRRRREALVAWSHRTRIPVIEDDYGADLSLEDGEQPPALRALDGDVLYVGTYSKKLIPALRIGFILCPSAVRAHVVALKHAMDLGTSAFLQHALAEFLDRGYLRAHLKRARTEYRARRDALESQLAASLPLRLRWRSPKTGVVLWLPLPAPFDAMTVSEEARRRGLLVSPGPLFSTSVLCEEGIRLTYCSEPPDRLAEAARRLGAAIEAIESRQLPVRPRAGQDYVGLNATP
jgi:DNA-binding transcriptional MocR family regulator